MNQGASKVFNKYLLIAVLIGYNQNNLLYLLGHVSSIIWPYQRVITDSGCKWAHAAKASLYRQHCVISSLGFLIP